MDRVLRNNAVQQDESTHRTADPRLTHRRSTEEKWPSLLLRIVTRWVDDQEKGITSCQEDAAFKR